MSSKKAVIIRDLVVKYFDGLLYITTVMKIMTITTMMVVIIGVVFTRITPSQSYMLHAYHYLKLFHVHI